MTNRILILKGKHGENIFDASTPEALALAALAGLSINSYYYSRPDEPYLYPKVTEEDEKLLALTDAELAAIPEAVRGDIVKKINGLRNRINRAQAEYDEQVEFYDKVKALLDLPIEEAVKQTVTVGVRQPRQIPLALDLLEQRQDYEYEGFEIETLSDPTNSIRPMK